MVALFAVGSKECDFGCIDGFLVVQRLQAARAQDRLAQPLQPEHQQDRADDQAQRVDRQVRQGGTEARDDDDQPADGGGDAPPGGSPATRDPHREDDREGLDHLDGGRQERGGYQENAVHRDLSFGRGSSPTFRR